MTAPGIERWTAERIDAQAPDAQTARAGLKLADTGRWPESRVSGALLWGRCQGSGKRPYQVAVDLTGPAFTCSCPSRKFPCKHAVALLHLWSQGRVVQAEPDDFAEEWRRRRAARAAKAAAKAPAAERTAQQRASAEARVAKREQRISDGLDELDRWLVDQMNEGLARTGERRGQALRAMAARMVDAQAPGMAERLTALAGVTGQGPDWPSVLTEEYGMVRLLIRAWRRREELPDGLDATVRTHLGVAVRTEEVLAGPGIDDDWAVMGVRRTEEGRLRVQREWLLGARTGRWALLLSFSTDGSASAAGPDPGMRLRARLHPYPGRGQLRCACSEQSEPVPLSEWTPPSIGVAAAHGTWRDAVALDPWVESHPAVVAGRLSAGASGRLALADDDGALPFAGGVEDGWRLALTAGHDELVVAGELSREGLRPMSLVEDGRVVPL